MISKLFFQIISGILGIFLAARLIPGVEFIGSTQILLLSGSILGLVNFFIKPILKAITFPIRLLTFGLFSLVINMFLVWVVIDILFSEAIEIKGIIPLFWTAMIVWIINLVFEIYISKKSKRRRYL